jgi:protein involved in polysaccharide export with SLBB domain
MCGASPGIIPVRLLQATKMLSRTVRVAAVLAAAVSLATRPAHAQALPTPAQAQQMLEGNPALVARIQQLVQSSGLTSEQIRARLRAQGYPDSMLDQYLPGQAKPETAQAPTDDVFAAIRAIGLVDAPASDSMSALARARFRGNPNSESAFLDSLKAALKNDTTAAALRAVLQSQAAQREELDNGFRVFAADLFTSSNSQFDANTVVGADPTYRFGPGDRMVLFLTGDVQKQMPLIVNPQGFVVVPDVGQLNVAGLTRAQFEDMLYARLGAAYSGVRRGPDARTRFYIDLAQMGTNQVYVNGDVVRPNSYRLLRASTILTALYMAGGPTANGTMRNVEVRRNGKVVATLDVYDYALRGDATTDIRLENDDIIFVPPRGSQVRVSGAVLRPAIYELKKNQTLAEVLKMAGGFREAADRRRIEVERIVPPAERTIAGRDRKTYNFSEDLLETAPALGGDVVHVSEIARRVVDRVIVTGNVWMPGHVSFTPGMTLYDALRRSGGLKPDAYLGDVQVERLNPDSTRTLLRSAVKDTVGHPVDNIALADGDEIKVYSAMEMRPKRYVTVGGAIAKAGTQIPYREGMTLRDALLLAGGFQEGALLTQVEVARLPEERADGLTATTINVPLDSSYLFERGADRRIHVPPGIVLPTGQNPEFYLQPYDAILVKWQPDWQTQQTVSIRGEVRFPGDYSLVHKTERLADVITRAGGFTAAAYPAGVVFVRKANGVGRVGIDLASVLKNRDNSDNLQLVDGDSIFVPRFTPVVIVRGAVNSPSGVAYVEGEDLDYYIRSAGGPTHAADRGATYVTQTNGKVEAARRHLVLFHSTPTPQPGSTVTVPLKDTTERRDWLQVTTAATSLLGSMVAIVALIRR